MNNKLCFASALCLCLTFGLCSCGESNAPESKDNTAYSVRCEESDFYVCSGTVKATAGLTATITLTSNFDAYEITGCTFNDSPCTKVSENGKSKEFSFVMPSSDVVIKVLDTWHDVSSDGKNDFVTFSSDNVYTTSLSSLGDSLDLEYTTNANFMTIAKKTVFSVREDILPSSAITVTDKQASSSNMIVGGVVSIDLTSAKIGSTQIVLHIKNDNTSGYEGVIVATVTFTE